MIVAVEPPLQASVARHCQGRGHSLLGFLGTSEIHLRARKAVSPERFQCCSLWRRSTECPHSVTGQVIPAHFTQAGLLEGIERQQVCNHRSSPAFPPPQG